jgi:hypothetical protein
MIGRSWNEVYACLDLYPAHRGLDSAVKHLRKS